jgi:hypothetical protein
MRSKRKSTLVEGTDRTETMNPLTKTSVVTFLEVNCCHIINYERHTKPICHFVRVRNW